MRSVVCVLFVTSMHFDTIAEDVATEHQQHCQDEILSTRGFSIAACTLQVSHCLFKFEE